MTNRQIADALFVTVKTVEANVTRIFRKMGITSRAQLIHTMTRPAPADTPSARPHVTPDVVGPDADR
jgi:hypothetical protein